MSVHSSPLDPLSPTPGLDTSRQCPQRPNTLLWTHGLQEHVLILKINLHSVHTVLCLKILPLFYNDSNRDQRNTAFHEKVSVNTLLKIFILNISVAFQFIIVLLVSLHKSAMHLY